MFKVLGKKFKRGSNFSVFKIGHRVYKLPLVPAAVRELKIEMENIKTARQDLHFQNYLPPYQFNQFMISLPYYQSIILDSSDQSLVLDYFKNAFNEFQDWPEVSLSQVINCTYLLDFIKKNLDDKLEMWQNYLSTQKISSSSMHGDFHWENILIKDKILFFVDWVRYQKTGSRFFDLVDFAVFARKKPADAWFEGWQQLSQIYPNHLYNVAVTQDEIMAYSIWKIAEELKTLNLRKKLDGQKTKKYLRLLEIIGKRLGFYD